MTRNLFSDPIILTPHRADWEHLAQAEIRRLRESLVDIPISDIQHIGSTAIRGIRAKPILDIQLLVAGPSHFPGIITAVQALGYEYWADNPNTAQLFFVKGRPPHGKGRTHHVHVLYDSEKFEDAVLFRDALNGDPALAMEYEALKLELAAKYATQREAYTEGKTAFVTDVVRNARWATA